MTQNCSNTTASPNQGEVAHGYWNTLQLAFCEVSNLDTHDIEKRQLSELSAPVSVVDYLSLFERGLELDSAFGLEVGKSVSLKTFPVLGMTLLSCSNLKQALEQILRYESLNHDLGSSELRTDAGISSYVWMPNLSYIPKNNPRVGFQLALSVFSGIKTFAPLLLQQMLPIKHINFVTSDTKIQSVLEGFFGCPVHFGKKVNSIEVASDVLERELAFADPSMFTALTKHAESLLINDKNSFAHRVKALFPDALNRQKFKIEDLARALNLSTRTIQRKLKEEGYTYQVLLDETRLQLAKVYLQENELSMNEIAFMVGYQEQSSFNHAFKNWTGQSPREFASN